MLVMSLCTSPGSTSDSDDFCYDGLEFDLFGEELLSGLLCSSTSGKQDFSLSLQRMSQQRHYMAYAGLSSFLTSTGLHSKWVDCGTLVKYVTTC